MVARTAQVSQGGWAAVLDALRPGRTRWLGENRLQVNLHEYPPREISGAELVFVPVTPQGGLGVLGGAGPVRHRLPCAGALADHAARAPPPRASARCSARPGPACSSCSPPP